MIFFVRWFLQNFWNRKLLEKIAVKNNQSIKSFHEFRGIWVFWRCKQFTTLLTRGESPSNRLRANRNIWRRQLSTKSNSVSTGRLSTEELKVYTKALSMKFGHRFLESLLITKNFFNFLVHVPRALNIQKPTRSLWRRQPKIW